MPVSDHGARLCQQNRARGSPPSFGDAHCAEPEPTNGKRVGSFCVKGEGSAGEYGLSGLGHEPISALPKPGASNAIFGSNGTAMANATSVQPLCRRAQAGEEPAINDAMTTKR